MPRKLFPQADPRPPRLPKDRLLLKSDINALPKISTWKSKYSAQERYYKKNSEWRRAFRMKIRKETIKAYGGKCKCCGEHRWEFLTLDHPDGNGIKDRAKYAKRSGQIYRWAKENGFPKIYRLLCMNCNWTRRYGRKCPHEIEKLVKGA